jgi:hypothetical protein
VNLGETYVQQTPATIEMNSIVNNRNVGSMLALIFMLKINKICMGFKGKNYKTPGRKYLFCDYVIARKNTMAMI